MVTLGTPLGPVALTALSTQPTADAVRLLARLLPPVDPEAPPEDDDLRLGRRLVGALTGLKIAPRPKDVIAEVKPLPPGAVPAAA